MTSSDKSWDFLGSNVFALGKQQNLKLSVTDLELKDAKLAILLLAGTNRCSVNTQPIPDQYVFNRVVGMSDFGSSSVRFIFLSDDGSYNDFLETLKLFPALPIPWLVIPYESENRLKLQLKYFSDCRPNTDISTAALIRPNGSVAVPALDINFAKIDILSLIRESNIETNQKWKMLLLPLKDSE